MERRKEVEGREKGKKDVKIRRVEQTKSDNKQLRRNQEGKQRKSRGDMKKKKGRVEA